MTADPRDRLFARLPAVYRNEDARDGELQRLLRLIGAQAESLREDVQQLWDDFFIETCQNWVVPYVGDLVGTVPLRQPDREARTRTASSAFTDLVGPELLPVDVARTRADVARTIGYRRRKGTPPALETLARDVTGWDAHVVEFATLLRWNQHPEHVRPDAPGNADLRRPEVCTRIGGPWDTAPYSVDVRRIAQDEGWHNLPNIGFFLWRLQALTRTASTPRASGAGWRLTFSPLGDDTPLFSAGRGLPEEFALADESCVQAPIRPAAFAADLRTGAKSGPTVFYGDFPSGEGSLEVLVDGVALPASQIACSNLDGWEGLTNQPPGSTVLVDVRRGRILVPDKVRGRVTVSFRRGFSGGIGGGEYDDRSGWRVALPPGSPTNPVVGGGGALQAAIAGRSAPGPGDGPTIIEVGDSATYDVSAPLTLATDESLVIQAANGAAPHVRITSANAEWSIDSKGAGASLTLAGLLVEGALRITGDLERLRLLHTTLVPDRSVDAAAARAGTKPSGPGIVVEGASSTGTPINRGLRLQIAFSITGALRIPHECAPMLLLDSIIDGAGSPAIEDAAGGHGPPAHIERCTLLGASRFLKLDLASETIFADTVTVVRRQGGCVRFCFVPIGSQTPQQYRCQPSLEIGQRLDAVRRVAPGGSLPAGARSVVENSVSRWLEPAFESVRYGEPAYAQLRRATPRQVRLGGDDGGEMGAFAFLEAPLREANLRLRLDEYLPVGHAAGLIYVT